MPFTANRATRRAEDKAWDRKFRKVQTAEPVNYRHQIDAPAELFVVLEGLMEFAHSFSPEDVQEDPWALEQFTVLWQTVELVSALYGELLHAQGAINAAISAQTLGEGVDVPADARTPSGLVLPDGVDAS